MVNEIKKYTKLGIDKIRDVNILEKNDMNLITKLTGELQRVFEVKQVWRTETEIRYSVLNENTSRSGIRSPTLSHLPVPIRRCHKARPYP